MLINGILFRLLHLSNLGLVRIRVFICALIAGVQRRAFFDIDLITLFVFIQRLNIIPDFAFKTDIGHDSVSGFRVDTGHIARVRVPVRVSIDHVEENDEFITILNRVFEISTAHLFSSPFLILLFLHSALAFDDSIQG